MQSGEFEIAGRLVGRNQPPYVLAEIGINHGGDTVLAERMIEVAAECGADGVKFQTFRADDLVNKKSAPEQWEIFSKCELDEAAHRRLKERADNVGVAFISTPFSYRDVDLLAGMDVPAIKIASGDLTNHPLLRYVGKLGLPVILSTGMSYLEEVSEAREVLIETGCPNLVLLHCVSRYPAQAEELNLRAIQVLASTFPDIIGFSDHTEGIWAAMASVALGARFIEKHFTLDKRMPGPDHSLSAEPHELKAIVETAKLVFKSLGEGEKKPTVLELKNRHFGRKGLYASRDLPPGHVIKPDDVRILRPETGIKAGELHIIIGRKVQRPLKEGEPFTWDIFGGRDA